MWRVAEWTGVPILVEIHSDMVLQTLSEFTFRQQQAVGNFENLVQQPDITPTMSEPILVVHECNGL